MDVITIILLTLTGVIEGFVVCTSNCPAPNATTYAMDGRTYTIGASVQHSPNLNENGHDPTLNDTYDELIRIWQSSGLSKPDPDMVYNSPTAKVALDEDHQRFVDIYFGGTGSLDVCPVNAVEDEDFRIHNQIDVLAVDDPQTTDDESDPRGKLSFVLVDDNITEPKQSFDVYRGGCSGSKVLTVVLTDDDWSYVMTSHDLSNIPEYDVPAGSAMQFPVYASRQIETPLRIEFESEEPDGNKRSNINYVDLPALAEEVMVDVSAGVFSAGESQVIYIHSLRLLDGYEAPVFIDEPYKIKINYN